MVHEVLEPRGEETEAIHDRRRVTEIINVNIGKTRARTTCAVNADRPRTYCGNHDVKNQGAILVHVHRLFNHLDADHIIMTGSMREGLCSKHRGTASRDVNQLAFACLRIHDEAIVIAGVAVTPDDTYPAVVEP